MPYQQNKPLATDQLDDSQGDIQGNFQEIYNLIGINHEQFGAAAGQGKHKEVTLPFNVAPTPTGATEANIYSVQSGKAQTFLGQSALLWQKNNNGPVIDMTSFGVIGGAGSFQGYTVLPSGVLLKFGRATVNGLNQTVTFPVNVVAPNIIPVFNGTYAVIAVPFVAVGQICTVQVHSLGNTTFTISARTLAGGAFAGAEIYYLAIGVQ